jgi:outer membrane protein assembly factor BamE (lipoprotein component of BamABCDE complex)
MSGRFRKTLVSFQVGMAMMLIAGCLVTQDATTTQSGTVFDTKMLGTLSYGMSAADVRGVLGPPSSIFPESDNKQRWKYAYTSSSEGSLTVFPFFNGNNQSQCMRDAAVEFRDEKVIAVWADGNSILPLVDTGQECACTLETK